MHHKAQSTERWNSSELGLPIRATMSQYLLQSVEGAEHCL